MNRPAEITRLVVATPLQGELVRDDHLDRLLSQGWTPLSVIHHSSLKPGQREVWLSRLAEEA